jgi:hypothetical protein
MRKSNHERIRKILRTCDGMTVVSISDLMGVDQSSIRQSLKDMVDAYIDRWVSGARGSWQAVWCVVDVPEDCPKPERKEKA